MASRTSRERRRSAPVPPRSAPRTARARREPARRTTAAASWCEVRAGSPGPGPPLPSPFPPPRGHLVPAGRVPAPRPGTGWQRDGALLPPIALPPPPPRHRSQRIPGRSRAAGSGLPVPRSTPRSAAAVFPGSPPCGGERARFPPARSSRAVPGSGAGLAVRARLGLRPKGRARPGAAGRAGGPGEQRRGHGTIPPAAPRPPPGRPSPAGGTRGQRERGESISFAFKALSQEKSVMERRRVRGYLVVVWCLVLGFLGFFFPFFIISLARPGLGVGGRYAAGPARGTAGPGASGCDRVQPPAGPGARWDRRVFYGKPRKVRGGGESRRGCGRRGGAERSPGRGSGGGSAAPSRGRAWGCSAGVSPPPRPPNRSPGKLRGCPASSPAFGQARAVGTGASAPARPCPPSPLPRGRRGPIPVPARSP